jgi:hypothetical protein
MVRSIVLLDAPMQLSWSMLVMLVAAAALGWFWRAALAARERANEVALQACERLSLQLLDGTVAFARLAIVRGDHGRLALRRTYVFDYTAHSIERRQGFVVLTGLHVDSVGFAPDAAESATPFSHSTGTSASAERHHSTSSGDNVLDLEEWRTRRKRG